MNPKRRNLRDAQESTTKALPAAAATNYHDSYDLGDGPHRERLAIELEVPILAALVDTKTVTFELQHSADNSTFTDVGDALETSGSATTNTGSINAVVTGSETPGTPAACVFRFPVPETCLRYVRIAQTVVTGGGDNTAVSTTTYLVS